MEAINLFTIVMRFIKCFIWRVRKEVSKQNFKTLLYPWTFLP